MISAALGDTGLQKNIFNQLFGVEFIKSRPFFKKIFYQSEDSGSRKMITCMYIHTYDKQTYFKHSGTTHMYDITYDRSRVTVGSSNGHGPKRDKVFLGREDHSKT